MEHIRRKTAVDIRLRDKRFVPRGVYPLQRYGEISALSQAGEDINVDRKTMSGWVTKVKGTEYEPDWSLWPGRDTPPPIVVDNAETPFERREIRDASFWRKKASDLQKQLAEVEHIAEQLAGIRNQPITVPPWASTPKGGKPRKAVLGLLLSDIHAGEVVRADELDGLNEFNLDICRRRLRRLFAAACEIGPRWLSDCECQGAFLALGGDLISGSIHEELRMTNALQDHGQVRFIIEELSIGINLLLDVFGKILIASVPGNHGRTTIKDTSKLYSNLNYDTFIADMVSDRFRNDPRVIFWGGYSTDQFVPIFNWTVHLTHGHKTGTGGGQGFVGPDLPIVRGAKKIAEQQGSVGRRVHLQLRGHMHYSTNPGRILSNGSVPGLTEYARDLRAAVEPPKQWLFLIHEKWCLRERMDVQLEDPSVPDKPRVRVYV
jgi:hypothetical protein